MQAQWWPSVTPHQHLNCIKWSIIVLQLEIIWIKQLIGPLICELIKAEWRIYASVFWPSLVQIMACHLVGAKPLSKPYWTIVNWTLRNKLQWNLKQNLYTFIQENAFGNVVGWMAAILSLPQCANCRKLWTTHLPRPLVLEQWCFHFFLYDF